MYTYLTVRRILVSWVGRTDLRAPTEATTVGDGPIAQAVTARQFDDVCLLSDYDEPTVALEGEGGRALFGGGIDGKEYSEKVSADIDAEVKHIIDEAYKKASDIIKTQRKVLDAIAVRLIEVETIEREEFEQILIAHGITPKRYEPALR